MLCAACSEGESRQPPCGAGRQQEPARSGSEAPLRPYAAVSSRSLTCPAPMSAETASTGAASEFGQCTRATGEPATVSPAAGSPGPLRRPQSHDANA
jgi:hypothetical protein